MTLSTSNTWWAAIVIVVVPLVVIAAAELDERLRQRESPLRSAVVVLRNWAVPSFAVWAIAVPVVGADADAPVPIIAASVLVLSIAAAAGVALTELVRGVAERRRSSGRPVPQLLLALPRLGLILVTGWILIGEVWGVDLSAALAALGVTSLVISFALQDTLSGLASGMLLLSDQPFQPGDWISSGDIEGQVLDINWRTTRIRNRQGGTIIVPNSQLAGASILNYADSAGLHRVDVDLQVAYSNPPTVAKAMLLDAARSTPGVLESPEPVVVVKQIDDPLMGYQVQMWVDDYAHAPRVAADFGALVWYHSDRHGVPLPSPAHDLYVYDGLAAGAASVPTTAELRRMLAGSQLLGSLGDDDLDRLAHASRLANFSVGEVLVDTRTASTDLMLIATGRATFDLVDSDGTTITVSEVGPGESVGLLRDAPGDNTRLSSRALQDCAIVIVDALAVADVGSRNLDVAAAFSRVTDLRRRRVERAYERRRDHPGGEQ